MSGQPRRGAVLDHNALSAADFVARYGELFEHSPWLVERAAAARPFADLHSGLMAVLVAASDEDRLRLIRAHPELAGKAASAGTLSAASQHEQSGAGLDRLSPDQYGRFQTLNRAYRERFGFPFVICVRHHDSASLLAALERRSQRSRSEEISTALNEIGEIVRLRLEALP